MQLLYLSVFYLTNIALASAKRGTLSGKSVSGQTLVCPEKPLTGFHQFPRNLLIGNCMYVCEHWSTFLFMYGAICLDDLRSRVDYISVFLV